MKTLLTTFVFLHALIASAQVGDIKSASSSNASSRGERGGSGGSAFFIYFMADAINGLADWQQYKLKKREINPSLVSLDVITQLATQPSRYYLVNPRVRGNWGLFSSDFRINYLLEETVNGITDLSSIDWQLVQFNMVTTRHVVGRLGAGFMKENFGGRKTFFESSVGALIQSSSKKTGVSLEYRWAQDFETDVIARREFSAQFEKRLFSRGYWNTYLTIGGVYQRYYESISVWGVQAGLAFRIFAPAIPFSPTDQ
ncbi:MAG: hypothetical protein ORN54_12055 [Cyclobacteriaceae bacterium]|nr:hypothetical protein [Cyclobacteriaceae bacterium]